MRTPARRVYPRAAGLVAAIVVMAGALAMAGGAAASRQAATAATPDFGPDVKIFTPAMSTSQIKTTVAAGCRSSPASHPAYVPHVLLGFRRFRATS
jgi:hypothetical protein